MHNRYFTKTLSEDFVLLLCLRTLEMFLSVIILISERKTHATVSLTQLFGPHVLSVWV